jgi:hypothetical protein
MSFRTNHEFVTKEIADLVKSKGFDFNCLGIYIGVDDVITSGEKKGFAASHAFYKEQAAPLYQQIFLWLDFMSIIVIIDYDCEKSCFGYKIYNNNSLLSEKKNVSTTRIEAYIESIKVAINIL